MGRVQIKKPDRFNAERYKHYIVVMFAEETPKVHET